MFLPVSPSSSPLILHWYPCITLATQKGTWIDRKKKRYVPTFHVTFYVEFTGLHLFQVVGSYCQFEPFTLFPNALGIVGPRLVPQSLKGSSALPVMVFYLIVYEWDITAEVSRSKKSSAAMSAAEFWIK